MWSKRFFDQFSRRSRLRGGDGDENFVQLVGWLAVFRGLVILKRVGDGTTRESSDTAFVHIIGGALAANVVGTAIALGHTFGLTLPI